MLLIPESDTTGKADCDKNNTLLPSLVSTLPDDELFNRGCAPGDRQLPFVLDEVMPQLLGIGVNVVR